MTGISKKSRSVDGWTAGLPKSDRLWQALTGRNDDGPVQGIDRTSVASARGFAAQQTEAAIGVAVLNQMLMAGRPDSVCCLRVMG